MTPTNAISYRIAFALALPVSTLGMDEFSKFRPDFKIYQARAKQHRQGARADLVEGEEHLRKIILGWEFPPDCPSNAKESFEICNQCEQRVNEDTGIEIDGATGGKVLTDVNMCGGKPCVVMPGAPFGSHTFHLRCKSKDGQEWSAWSQGHVFDLSEDIGSLQYLGNPKVKAKENDEL